MSARKLQQSWSFIFVAFNKTKMGIVSSDVQKIGVEVDKHGQKYNIYIRREFV